MSLQIAIDGPAAAGKSTIAKIIAEKFNFEYLDTGAMYRAATVKALALGIDLNDEAQYSFINNTKIDFRNNRIFLDNKDVSEKIRTLEVSNNVSVVCKYQIVRERMVSLQQKIASSKNIVMDGRDIGTVVLPKANLKIFLSAAPEERARRRMMERIAAGTNIQTLEETIKEICERDYKDSHREIAPLKKADDAIEIDSSHLSINEVVEIITRLVTERGWNMGKVNKITENVAEEVTKEEIAEEVISPATAEAAEEITAENDLQVLGVRELQLVEGTVVNILPAEEEVKGQNGKTLRRAKGVRVVVALDNGLEGYLLAKDVAGIKDDEDLYDEFLEGDRVRLVIKKIYPDGGKVLLSATLVEKRDNLKKFQAIINNHGTIVAKVTKVVPVGVVLDHEGYSCLLPTSQISMSEEEMANILNTEITVAPIRVDYNRIRLIVSQKVANAINERKNKQNFISKISVGDIFEGTVKNLESYGAFVELSDGVEGLLHVSEIEHNRVVNVEKHLKPGDKLKVQVIKLSTGHIGLSRKALVPNYWKDFIDTTAIGEIITGKVCEINKAGAVININEHIQGFLPKSEISWERDSVIEDLFSVDQNVELKVIELDIGKKRVILSKKQMADNPWDIVDFRVGEIVDCIVTKEINEGIKLLIKGVNGFLPKSFYGDKTTFVKGEVLQAKVRVFEAEKHKLIVSLKELVTRPKPVKKEKSISETKSQQKQDKITGTFGDFINLDDFK